MNASRPFFGTASCDSALLLLLLLVVVVVVHSALGQPIDVVVFVVVAVRQRLLTVENNYGQILHSPLPYSPNRVVFFWSVLV